MNYEEKNNLHYVCTLVEFLSRKTKNRHEAIAERISQPCFEQLMRDASVNHCLSFDEVSAPLINELDLSTGTYDPISTCRFKVPSVEDIGWLYQRLILQTMPADNLWDGFRSVFQSFIPPVVSNFNSSFYYSSPDYIRACYQAGQVLDD